MGKYQKDTFEDENDDILEKEFLVTEPFIYTPTKRAHRVYLLVSCFLVALGLSAAVGVDIFLRLRWRIEYPFHVERIYHCGKTAEEARSNGCIFELMTVSWVPAACYDDELNQEFRSARDWHFWRDIKGEKELSEAELPDINVPTYGSNEFHRMHCGYSWMKMHRALDKGRRIDRGLSYYKHTAHCKELYRNANMTAIGTDVTVGFGSC